jgi:hypothetical protein
VLSPSANPARVRAMAKRSSTKEWMSFSEGMGTRARSRRTPVLPIVESQP